MKDDGVRSPRERLPFNDGWRFHRHDGDFSSEGLSYAALKPWLLLSGAELVNAGTPRPTLPPGERPGREVPFADRNFDDTSWRALDLPHDYAIEGPFSPELPGETAKLPWHGVAWYRKRFFVPAEDRGRKVELEVDGALAFSSVFLNGHLVGGWPYGYSSFSLDLTELLEPGGENVLAVRLDSPENSSRWYPGGGIYRNVWLTKTERIRIQRFGVFVHTPRVDRQKAIVNVDVTLENGSDSEAPLSLSTKLYLLGADGRPEGKPIAKAEPVALKLEAGMPALRTIAFRVAKPKLWGLDSPHRYVAVTLLEANGKLVDRVETPFGIRSIEFDPDRGFLLNGERVPLNGVCMHHDLGALGAAFHVRAAERQLEILQSMGCNAVRTSHNPPAPELLELCDKMGLVVIAEAFDCWRRGKKQPPDLRAGDPGFRYFDYGSVFDDWHERDLRLMVRRDRNHPSVVLWSIGNEVLEQWYSDGWQLATRLAGIVREEDRTRPTTSAFNGEIAGYSGFQTAVDVVGFNYKPRAYPALHESNPTLPLLGSETASTLSSRGHYFFPISDDKLHGQVDFQVSSYDLSATPWAELPDSEFRGLDEAPYVAGEFVWTGFDYLGEPTPYNSDATNLLNFSDPEERQRAKLELERLGRIQVPSRSSYFGIIDLAGFPKDRFYIYQARWRPKHRMAHILPHWNWPERIGEVTPVHVYSSGDEAELFLNGKSQGIRKRSRLEYRFRWDEVVYAPGKLRVVTYRKGKKWATATCKTTGPAAGVRLEADRETLRADGMDLSFVKVSIVDVEGLTVPRANATLRFSLQGPGLIAGVDNGDPTSFESFQATERKAFNGLALVIVKTRRDEAGTIHLRAESEALSGGEVRIRTALS